MTPAESTRVWRRSQRQVITTYGRHQKDAAWRASWAGVRYKEQRRQDRDFRP